MDQRTPLPTDAELDGWVAFGGGLHDSGPNKLRVDAGNVTQLSILPGLLNKQYPSRSVAVKHGGQWRWLESREPCGKTSARDLAEEGGRM